MAFKTAILILSLVFNCGFGYDFLESDEPTESIIWPTEYYFKGEIIHLTSGIILPFQIWYSAENNRSRMDYYDGMIKKYYNAETEDSIGSVYVVHPQTTEEVTNEIICEEYYDEEFHDFLPDIEDFHYDRTESYEDKVVQVWKKVMENDGKKKQEELYVHRTARGVDIPVKVNTRVFNLWTDGLISQSVVNYYNYESVIKLDDLEIKSEDICISSRKKLGENFETDLKYLHPDVEHDLDTAFHSYKRHHNKKYEEQEHEMRKNIFQDNWRHIINHNRKNLSYKLAVNEFADRTDEELQYLTATRPSDPHEIGTEPFPFEEDELEELVEQIPENFDLRLEGVITPVKNQASCGSCWAFCTTAAIEGVVARNNGGRNLDLSEQSLIDCSWGFGNSGCNGGDVNGALKYVLKHGIPTEMEYGSYLQEEGYCYIENMTETYEIRGFGRVTTGNANAMKLALYKYGPVAVAIYARKDMKFYSSGIFYDIDCESGIVNHGVTVVGYGVRDGVLYWIVKNSWGANWGEDGYILMSATNDNCNLLSAPYYPIY